MNNNIKNVIKKVLILFAFWKFVDKFPKLQKYSEETRFSIYRSLMCLFFTLYALQNAINHFSDGFNNPFNFKSNDFDDILTWFGGYIILDLIKIFLNKKKRMDLLVHHGIFLIYSFMNVHFDTMGYFCSSILIAEAISIFSGIDKLEMEKNNMKISKVYKEYRKFIIKYVRIPIWITVLLTTLRFSKHQPNILLIFNIILPLFMIKMDKFWEGKCDKIISKYKS